MNIDDIDNQIINLLKKNAQYTSAELSDMLGISASTIRRRTKRLIDLEIIKLATIPDHEKLGRPLLVTIAIDVVPGKADEVADKLGEFENCTWVSVVTGRFSIITLWRFRNHDELYHITDKKLGEVEGITRIESFINLRLGKHP